MIAAAETNADGRIIDLLGAPLEAGAYRLTFDVAAYFLGRGGDAPFLTHVHIDFQVSDPMQHYHVPLLLSRYSCVSYRGS